MKKLAQGHQAGKGQTQDLNPGRQTSLSTAQGSNRGSLSPVFPPIPMVLEREPSDKDNLGTACGQWSLWHDETEPDDLWGLIWYLQICLKLLEWLAAPPTQVPSSKFCSHGGLTPSTRSEALEEKHPACRETPASLWADSCLGCVVGTGKQPEEFT